MVGGLTAQTTRLQWRVPGPRPKVPFRVRSSRAALAAAMTSLVLVPALAACSSSNAPASQATATATNPAHKPLNKPDDLKILDGISVSGDDPAVTPKVTIAAPPVNISATAV